MSLSPPTKRQAQLFWTAMIVLVFGIIGVFLFLLVWGWSCVLAVLSPVLWPLAVAGVLAYLLDPVVDCFERRGFSRSRAIVSVFAIALVIVLVVLANIGPPIVRQTREFAANVPKIIGKASTAVEKWMDNPPSWAEKFLKSSSAPVETPSDLTTTNETPS